MPTPIIPQNALTPIHAIREGDTHFFSTSKDPDSQSFPWLYFDIEGAEDTQIMPPLLQITSRQTPSQLTIGDSSYSSTCAVMISVVPDNTTNTRLKLYSLIGPDDRAQVHRNYFKQDKASKGNTIDTRDIIVNSFEEVGSNDEIEMSLHERTDDASFFSDQETTFTFSHMPATDRKKHIRTDKQGPKAITEYHYTILNHTQSRVTDVTHIFVPEEIASQYVQFLREKETTTLVELFNFTPSYLRKTGESKAITSIPEAIYRACVRADGFIHDDDTIPEWSKNGLQSIEDIGYTFTKQSSITKQESDGPTSHQFTTRVATGGNGFDALAVNQPTQQPQSYVNGQVVAAIIRQLEQTIDDTKIVTGIFTSAPRNISQALTNKIIRGDITSVSIGDLFTHGALTKQLVVLDGLLTDFHQLEATAAGDYQVDDVVNLLKAYNLLCRTDKDGKSAKENDKNMLSKASNKAYEILTQTTPLTNFQKIDLGNHEALEATQQSTLNDLGGQIAVDAKVALYHDKFKKWLNQDAGLELMLVDDSDSQQRTQEFSHSLAQITHIKKQCDHKMVSFCTDYQDSLQLPPRRKLSIAGSVSDQSHQSHDNITPNTDDNKKLSSQVANSTLNTGERNFEEEFDALSSLPTQDQHKTEITTIPQDLSAIFDDNGSDDGNAVLNGMVTPKGDKEVVPTRQLTAGGPPPPMFQGNGNGIEHPITGAKQSAFENGSGSSIEDSKVTRQALGDFF